MAVRIAIAWTLDHPGQERALGEVQLPHVFAKVGLRRLAEAVDGKAPLLSQRNLVRIDLEDLLLVEAILQLEGDGNLDDLPPESLVLRQKEAAWKLHREGRPALRPAAGPQIVAQRPQQAEVV